jgi:hypothetical protein
MSQDIFLLTYDSPLFPAHWSMWVPSDRLGPGGDHNPLGKVIQVVGDPREGFEHEFKRNDELEGTGCRYHQFLLASVPKAFVVDVVGDGSFTTDKVAVDGIERCALSVPAPGKSLKPVDSDGEVSLGSSSLIQYPFLMACRPLLHRRGEQTFLSKIARPGSRN